MRIRKGRCIVAGYRKFATKQTGFEHMRGARKDALPHAYRDFWHMWRTLMGEAYRATPLGGRLGSHPPTLNLPRRTVADYHLPNVPLNDGLHDVLRAARTVTNVYQG